MKVDVRLWGGPQDGLKATVEVGQYTGPPSFVDVPERLRGSMNTVLRPDAEKAEKDQELPSVRYRLDQTYDGGTFLMYRLEHALHA